jgi:hypothetical protein
LGIDNRMSKSNFHVLADFIATEEIDKDVLVCLSLIADEAEAARAGRG